MPEKLYNSRKFQMGLLTLLLIVISSALILLNPLFVELYATLVGGLVTTFGLYCGMNVANKWTLGKAQGAKVGSMSASLPDELPQVNLPEEK